MGQKESSNNDRKGKHLSWEERIQIETLHREGYSEKDIGERLGRSHEGAVLGVCGLRENHL
ncbi:hypothetical protein PDESU_06091 [Pontiella desulfatans]|uniref:Transposase IS30-like HTH domain-containing protein n=1 Tax=Pontiella desulfatans TaxID=2750659 RepID=A0A6C2UBS0_PONDE|nr:hypothetical protein PDESU_06091 [Pontiella desulfatans]